MHSSSLFRSRTSFAGVTRFATFYEVIKSSGKDLMSEYSPEIEEEVDSQTRDEVHEPPMYKVLLYNDNYTTMDFVVEILIIVFNKSPEEAVEIMLNVHRKGIGVCGVYSYEISETKVETVHTLAREYGFPLKCTMEKE